MAAEEAACRANRALLQTRRELRGLVDALQAKARACGRAEDVELAALVRRERRPGLAVRLHPGTMSRRTGIPLGSSL